MSKELFFERRQEELASLIDQVENGEARALNVYAEIKRFKEMYVSVEKQIEPLAMDEAQDYSENTFEEDGFEFTKRNGATRYIYKGIPEWQTYSKALKECEARHKQAFISKQKGLMIASADGEEMVMPEIAYSKSSLVVKKLKNQLT